MIPRLSAGIGVATLGLGLLAGCGTADQPAADGKLTVTAGFYPLQYVAEKVGGDHVTVTNLTKPGAEAHDLEISPRTVDTIANSSVVLYLKGFQPAVDEAVEQNAASAGLDVSAAARLEPAGGHEVDDHDHHAQEPAAAEGADAQGHEEPAAAEGGDAHDHEQGLKVDGQEMDPHFWLDPARLADVADEAAKRFGEADPEHANEYTANAAALRTELTSLDQEYDTGLASCSVTDVVTSHAAFGYVTRGHQLNLIGISGIDPTQEPSPATMAEVTQHVREHGVTTIYTETVASPALADTIASETGAKTAVLDPLESLTADSTDDYQSIMRTNLETLRTGQACA